MSSCSSTRTTSTTSASASASPSPGYPDPGGGGAGAGHHGHGQGQSQGHDPQWPQLPSPASTPSSQPPNQADVSRPEVLSPVPSGLGIQGHDYEVSYDKMDPTSYFGSPSGSGVTFATSTPNPDYDKRLPSGTVIKTELGHGPGQKRARNTKDGEQERRAKSRRELIKEFYQGPSVPTPPQSQSQQSQPQNPDWQRFNCSNNPWPSSPIPVDQLPSSYPKMPSKVGTYQCSMCYRRLSSQMALEAHKESFHVSTPCSLCPGPLMLQGKSSWRRHMAREHPRELEVINIEKQRSEEVFVCHYCGKGLTKKSSLNAHLKSFHNPKKCQYCDQMVVGINMRKHMALKHKALTENDNHLTCCQQCLKVLSKRQLPSHVEVFHRMRVCPDCKKPCEGEKAFKLHRKYVHDDDSFSLKNDEQPDKIDKSQHSSSSSTGRKRFKFHCLSCTFSCMSKKDLHEHRVVLHPETIMSAKDLNMRSKYISKQEALNFAMKKQYGGQHEGHEAVATPTATFSSMEASYSTTNASYSASNAMMVKEEAHDVESDVHRQPNELKGENNNNNNGSIMELMRTPFDSWPECCFQQSVETEETIGQGQMIKKEVAQEQLNSTHQQQTSHVEYAMTIPYQDIVEGSQKFVTNYTGQQFVYDAKDVVVTGKKDIVWKNFSEEKQYRQYGQQEVCHNIEPQVVYKNGSRGPKQVFSENEIGFICEEVVGDQEVTLTPVTWELSQQKPQQEQSFICEVVAFTCSRCWKKYLKEEDFRRHECDGDTYAQSQSVKDQCQVPLENFEFATSATTVSISDYCLEYSRNGNIVLSSTTKNA